MKNRESLREISLALIVVGAGLGMYLNFYLGNRGWNNILMLFSLIFLPNWRQLLSLKLRIRTPAITFILIYQLYIFLYMILSQADSKDYIYLFFTIIVILDIVSLKRFDISWDKVIFYSWVLGWICALLCGSTLVTGAFFIEDAKAHSGQGYESILVDLSMAGNLVIFVVSCLFYIYISKGVKYYMALLGILLAVVMMLVLGKRTPIMVTLGCIVYFILRFYPPRRRIHKSYIGYVVGGIIALIGIFHIPGISELIVNVIDRTYHGVLDMLFGTTNSGMAAVSRYELREWALNYIDNNFGVINFIFGAGFMVKWLDVPILQAFLDMGIIGFCVYGYFILVVPLTVLFSRKSKNPYIFWAVGLCLYNMISIANSGTPYGHLRWLPIIILYTLMTTYTNSNHISISYKRLGSI